METKNDRTEDVRYLALGAVAAFLYGSTVFSLLFAMPLQTSLSKGGFRGFLVSLSVAFAGTAGWLVWQYHGTDIGVGGYLLMLSLPAGLAAAMALVNAGFLSSWPLAYRVMAGTSLVVAASTPSVFALFRNSEVVDFLRKGIEDMAASIAAAGGEGYAGAVLRSSLDPEAMLSAARRGIADGYAAVLYAFTFLGHWIGARASGPAAAGPKDMPRLASFRVPSELIWVFLGTWAAVLALRLPQTAPLPAHPAAEAVVWNAALTVSFLYALQGLGILRNLSERFAPAGPLRWAGVLLVVLLLFNTATGGWTAGILTVFGATETWIPYRISKGVQA